MAGRSPSSAATCAAVVGLTRPERLALGAAMGSADAARRAWATGCAGDLSAIVSSPALTRSAMPQAGRFFSTSDKGPGQNASASLHAMSFITAYRSAASIPGTCTISGLKRGRSLAANTLAMARASSALPPSP